MHADGALGAGLVRFVLAGRQAHCKCIWTTITLGGIFNGQFCQDLERYNGRAGTAAHRMVGFVAPVNSQEMANQRGVEQECTLTGHSHIVASVAYSPDGKHIVSGSYDNTVKIWDSTTGKEVSVLVCDRPFICCCVECSDLRVWSMSRSAR